MHLDRRKQTLLETIVVTYIQQAEPVGSHYLASCDALGVRSATIRNELAEMTELGYLRQPHTSAGRIPSDQGYRYYVDHLMTWDRMSAADARSVRGSLKMSEGDLEQLLMQTCRVLSSLTRYTSVATPPVSGEPTVRQTHMVQVAPNRVLVVVVLSSGQVLHRFGELPRSLTPVEVTRLSNALGALLKDMRVGQVAQVSPQVDELLQYEEVIRLLIGLISAGLAGEEGELYLEGASHILEHPEFREADKVEPLVSFLEARRTAFETLRQLLARADLTVSIGRENPHEAMREVSLVAARYSGGARAHGWVGVLGPTRMEYARSVRTVQYVAKALSETLSRLGFD
jgi:heat-inducible transcriptional repressor